MPEIAITKGGARAAAQQMWPGGGFRLRLRLCMAAALKRKSLDRCFHDLLLGLQPCMDCRPLASVDGALDVQLSHKHLQVLDHGPQSQRRQKGQTAHHQHHKTPAGP